MNDAPLPHLTGKKARPEVKQHRDWRPPILNIVTLTFGSTLLTLGAGQLFMFIRSPKYITTFASQNIPAITATAFSLLAGTYMIVSGVNGFVKMAKQRKKDAA